MLSLLHPELDTTLYLFSAAALPQTIALDLQMVPFVEAGRIGPDYNGTLFTHGLKMTAGIDLRMMTVDTVNPAFTGYLKKMNVGKNYKSNSGCHLLTFRCTTNVME